MEKPVTVMLDDAAADRILRFQAPAAVIAANTPRDIPAALALVESALAQGRHVAGWLGYELGYALEPRLTERGWPARPLLWFGVFDKPEVLTRADLGRTGAAYAGPLGHEWDEAAYTQRFDRVHDYIAAGDIYQANLSFRSRFHFAGDPLGLYLRLRGRAAAAHGAFIDDGARQVLSLSPELFFEIGADRRIVARPMKGTAPRGSDELADARAKAALAASPKDRAENLMIVDLVRNDIGRLALIGSVAVDKLFEVETYPTLHTMVSTVHGTLKPGTRVRDIVRALFPCGSVTGAPKIRAMEIIRELEQSPRDLYCGAIGMFAPDGSAIFNVAIRTITLEGGQGTLGIGGAVVQDSTAPSEYAECLLKARYFDSVREPICLIETLRHENGFVRLERHLARMEASAKFLDLPFDRAGADATLNRAVGGSDKPLRVRLTLDEAGAFECTTAPLGPAATHWRYAISPYPVRSDDALIRHKTTWRQFYDAEQLRLSGQTGCDEAVFVNERGEITEGSRTNLFIRKDGQLYTPPLGCGLLDGVLRRELLETGQCEERVLTPDDLATADEVLLGNSLRGLIHADPAASARATG
ncbi:MAG: aminodeoxychorismate synthase component I [Proteobacteria bacterium]|nr:aminodeoxychorismate synthase component I [Pseudomonadota bacterium]